jgi:hypothetical protein
MGSYLQILAFVVFGIVLLWFGYSLFFGRLSFIFSKKSSSKKHEKKDNNKGKPGDPQVCPVCSVRLKRGEQVKTTAFPPLSGSIDRMMYIRGCINCLENNMPRRCPICGIDLDINDYLVARMFERPNRRSHVHVLGCNRCKKMGDKAK